MRFSRRSAFLVFALALVAAAALCFSPRVAGQEEQWQWQILRADYGHKELRVDVMDRLTAPLVKVGPYGTIEVNNDSMGVDPAPGKAKSLRIFTKNSRNETREFELSEQRLVEARFFLIRRDNVGDRDRDRDRDRERARDRDWDRDDDAGLRIIRAYYGVQGRTMNVSDLLRDLARDGSVRLVVSNDAMGGDPAPGLEKALIVIYRYRGYETATAVREKNMLTIP